MTGLLIYVSIFKFDSLEQDNYLSENTVASKLELLPQKVDVASLELGLQEGDSLIAAIAILNTKVCPSCVSNTLEFFKEADKKEEFRKNFKIVFIDEPKEEVDRFVHITGMNHPVSLVRSEDIDQFFHDKKQTLLFLTSSSEVFHYFTIPVAHSDINRIRYEINNIIELSRLNS